MREAGIGRVLVASLHQAIADILPSRLEFYENWLNPQGLREGTIGLAPLLAVLSFLRGEGEMYPLVVDRAGEYAAEWTVSHWARRRALIRSLPAWLRARLVLRLARRMVRHTYTGTRAIVKLRRGTINVDLRGSVFCGVRQPATRPLCAFYATAIGRLLGQFSLDVDARVSRCRGMGDSACVLTIVVKRATVVPEQDVVTT